MWVSMLIKCCSYALRGPVEILRVDYHTLSAMIVRLYYLAFVEWEPFPGRAGKTVVDNGPSTLLLLEFLTCTEKSRVVGHVEHRRICHRP